MNLTKHDWIMFLYNFAVVVTGGYAAMTFEVTDRFVLLGMGFVFAIVWTVYFKYAMFHRFTDHPRFAGEDDEEEEEQAPMQL